jgi:hypothetical protein
MKLTRRAAERVSLVLAVRKAEKDAAKPKLNYDKLFDGLIYAVHDNV